MIGCYFYKHPIYEIDRSVCIIKYIENSLSLFSLNRTTHRQKKQNIIIRFEGSRGTRIKHTITGLRRVQKINEA